MNVFDRNGNRIEVGTKVAVAALNYRRANLRIGNVSAVDEKQIVIKTEAGGTTRSRIWDSVAQDALVLN